MKALTTLQFRQCQPRKAEESKSPALLPGSANRLNGSLPAEMTPSLTVWLVN
jgi:hypothetical protein